MCVEFVAAVAWLAELFDDPIRRERVLGYTQAFSSIGGFLVAVAYGLAGQFAPDLFAVRIPEFLTGMLGQVSAESQNVAWRYTLMSGLVPAIPLILIRPFLPESPKWKEKKDAGTLRRPTFGELFGTPKLRRTTIITTLMFACSYGVAFGAIQQVQHILPGLPQVKEAQQQAEADFEKRNAASKTPLAGKPLKIAIAKAKRGEFVQTKSSVTTVQEIGGLVGRVILAIVIVYFASRQKLIRMFLLPGLIVLPFTFGYAVINDLTLTYIGMFLAGLLTVAQFSFWGNYLPHAYPLHLRGTGESFAANIGGRIIGTSCAALTLTLADQAFMPGADGPARTAYTAAIVGTSLYLLNFILSFFLPELEPQEDELSGEAPKPKTV